LPTGRGWIVAGLGVAVFSIGLSFGSTIVQQLGFAVIGLVGLAIAVVRFGGHDLRIARQITPARARVDQPVELAITIRNVGSRPAPLILIEDRLPPGIRGPARFAVHGIEASGRRETTLALNPAKRGRYRVGPLWTSFVDPFGLAKVTVRVQSVSEFIVHPRVEPLSMPRDLGDRRSVTSSNLRQLSGARGEDFYTLREYAEGDDLRKIHWRSTAKRDQIMIRQEETPWHTRATIVLDDRPSAHAGQGHSSSSFERAVEAAASFADLYHRSGYGYRLVPANSFGIATGRGVDHYHRCLDLLAGIQTERGSDEDALRLRLAELDELASPEASLVVVTGTLWDSDAVALARAVRRYRQVAVVSFPAHRFGGQSTKSRWEGEGRSVEVLRLLHRAAVRTFVLGPDEPLGPAWGQSKATRHRMPWARKPERV